MTDTPTCTRCDQPATVMQPLDTNHAQPVPLCRACGIENQQKLQAERQQ